MDGTPIVIAGKSFKIERMAKKLKDGGTTVVSVSPTSKGWDIQYPTAGNIPPGNYDVRALIKVKGGCDGYGVRFAIYSPRTGKYLFVKIIKMTAIPKSYDYQWIKLGTATVSDDPRTYFFISCAGDKSFEQFLVKAVEFVPQKR